MKAIQILGTGSCVPPKVLTNQDIQDMGLDTTNEWIIKRTGIKERRIAEPHIASSDLALQASQKALEMAGMKAEEIDCIIVSTITPDKSCPSTANLLEGKLGAKHAVSFDVAAACSGFVFVLDIASQYLKTGRYKNILVAATEIMTREVNWKDRATCILWGDGAGAAILAKGDNGHEILSTHIHTDGANGSDLLVPGGGSSTTPISHESVDRGLHYLNLIEANASFRVAVRHFNDSINEAASHNDLAIEDIQWFIPHQANLRMFKSISKILKIPMDKFYVTITKYGNISSASCVIAFDEAVRTKSIKEGDYICIPVFGGGLTWGSALIRW